MENEIEPAALSSRPESSPQNKAKRPKKPKIFKPRIGGRVPKNWIYCPAIGEPLDIFVPFKVPLHTESFKSGINDKHSQLTPDGSREPVEFSIGNLIDYQKERNIKVCTLWRHNLQGVDIMPKTQFVTFYPSPAVYWMSIASIDGQWTINLLNCLWVQSWITTPKNEIGSYPENRKLSVSSNTWGCGNNRLLGQKSFSRITQSWENFKLPPIWLLIRSRLKPRQIFW